MAEDKAQLGESEIVALLDCADGHPAMLQAAYRAMIRSSQDSAWRHAAVERPRLCDELSGNPNVRLECAKIWSDLSPDEQDALIGLLGGHGADSELDALVDKGIVRISASGPQVFCDLFAGFVKRQQLIRPHAPRGVRVDVDAGDVWVDGRLAPVLTELEYRLLLLLYGSLDKICDKYKIVEAVWGESYIDEVDDARIEKLVSRLRQKIEPDSDEPKYLTTIRGRGYKLVSPAA
jgi:hypothetical protein